MAYTKASLVDYMAVELGSTVAALDEDVMYPKLEQGRDEIMALLGVDDIADVTDQLKLRVLARWQSWRAALACAVGQYDLKADTVSLTRSQLFDHIKLMLRDAEAAASVYPEALAVISGGAGIAYVGNMTTAGSPYRVTSEGGF